MGAVNTGKVEMRLEDALKAESRNFPATHHVILEIIQACLLRLDDNEL